MPKFKDANNQIHFLDQSDIDAGWLDKIQGANAWTPITDAEADVILNPPKSSLDLAKKARYERDSLIASTDWMVDRHRDQVEGGVTTSLTNMQFTSLLTYRQNLRDVPNQSGFPLAITWPIAP